MVVAWLTFGLPNDIEGVYFLLQHGIFPGVDPMMSKSKIKYISYVPTIVPAGRVLVHNLISHDKKTVPGTNGFRAWFDTPHHDYVICSCGWAAHLGTHYHEVSMEDD
jgi:hypothetical protein